MAIPVGISVFSGLGAETVPYLDSVAAPYESVWLPDHLQSNVVGVMEGWTLASYVLARYQDKMVGHQVLCNEFRRPALLAKMASTAQIVSDGRFVLGLGAGWHEAEARAYGIEFPPTPTRMQRLVEAIQLIQLLWGGGPVDFAGRFYGVTDARCLPAPETAPRVMVGASGEVHGLRAVAIAADWWNHIFRSPAEYRQKARRLADHCEAIGRDPSDIRHVLGSQILIAESEQEVRRAAERPDTRPVAQNGFTGTPEMIFETLSEAIDSGAGMVIAGFADSPRPDGAQLFAETVLRWLRDR